MSTAPADPLREAKRELRRSCRERVRQLPQALRARETTATCRTLERLVADAHSLGSYWALPWELDLAELHAWWWSRGHPLYLPRAGDGGVLEWRAVRSALELMRGRHGIMEPLSQLPAGLPVDATLLVPGVAFASDGARLGQGQGYYDRALRDHHGITIGVGFSVQQCESIPRQPHDRDVAQVVLGGQLWRAGRACAPP